MYLLLVHTMIPYVSHYDELNDVLTISRDYHLRKPLWHALLRDVTV
jgi:hypothetical protein